MHVSHAMLEGRQMHSMIHVPNDGLSQQLTKQSMFRDETCLKWPTNHPAWQPSLQKTVAGKAKRATIRCDWLQPQQ